MKSVKREVWNRVWNEYWTDVRFQVVNSTRYEIREQLSDKIPEITRLKIGYEIKKSFRKEL